MAPCITALVGPALLFISLSTLSLNVDSREVYLKIKKHGAPLKGSYASEKTGRLLECVYSCVEDGDCRSFGYNATSSICHLYPSQTVDSQKTRDILMFGSLGDILSDRTKKTPHPPTHHKSGIVLEVFKKKLTWLKANKKACGKGFLAPITNEVDQVKAVKIVNSSGLDTVAIGVYRNGIKWETKSVNATMLYSDWAEGEPEFLDFFTGLSKTTGYKWEGFLSSHRFDGALCLYS